MNNKIVKDVLKTKGGERTFTWYPEKIIEGLKVHMVYGFCLNKESKIVLVRDRDEERFTLPGGKIENNETALDGLIREFREEAQFTPEKIEVLGTLEVVVKNNDDKITDHHQQVRYLCSIESPGDFIPEKDGFETVERIFIDVAKLPDYIDWINYPTGKVQFEEFLSKIDKKSTTP